MALRVWSTRIAVFALFFFTLRNVRDSKGFRLGVMDLEKDVGSGFRTPLPKGMKNSQKFEALNGPKP